ncbi:MAG: type II toxin-antitoxin system Phd/YefM family antitoxin [Paucibacter sp.]|nr:type II toxin-antitoxin system Phd/YefM family antitoxin [Roseateles sp.]
MRYSSQVKTTSDLKANADEVLAQLADQREPPSISLNSEATAVLLDIASFEQAQEALAPLNLLALGNQDLEAGRVKPLAEVVARLIPWRRAGSGIAACLCGGLRQHSQSRRAAG